jgi:hypothetical protein
MALNNFIGMESDTILVQGLTVDNTVSEIYTVCWRVATLFRNYGEILLKYAVQKKIYRHF